jgi:hypothetical protein
MSGVSMARRVVLTRLTVKIRESRMWSLPFVATILPVLTCQPLGGGSILACHCYSIISYKCTSSESTDTNCPNVVHSIFILIIK